MSTMTEVRQISYSGAINLALRESMRADPTVILLGEDIAGGAGIDHMAMEDAGRRHGRHQGPRPGIRTPACLYSTACRHVQ